MTETINDNLSISTMELQKKNADTQLVSVTEPKDENQIVQSALMKAGTQATTLKDAIDIGVTGKALQKDGVIETLTDKKEQELKEDAEAKRLKSEADRLSEEANRTDKEKEKIDKESEKAKAYYNAHKSVLKYSFVKEPMSIPFMRIGAIMGTIVTFLFLPLIIAGALIELIVDIIGSVTGTITKNSIKLIVGLLVALFIVAVGVGCYFGIPLLLSRY